MAPIILGANQPNGHFYKGGSKIDAFRGTGKSESHQPEDWVASTTHCNGCADSKIGMAKLPDGRFLAEAVESDPDYWLGPSHLAKYGTDTKLLFKLLDAGSRLPVHAHPHVDWAKKHIGAQHGKAECWYVLNGGTIKLGLKEEIPRDQLLQWVNEQKTEELLSRMHEIHVKPHQTVFVPPGTLHSIGEGNFVVELQEPEDLSILLEWKGFEIDGEKDGHLGLGFPTALTAVDSTARSDEEIAKLVSDPTENGPTVAEASRDYFRLDRAQVNGNQVFDAGFAIVVVLEGSAKMTTPSSKPQNLPKGSTVVVAHGEGDFVLEGSADVLVARPPQ